MFCKFSLQKERMNTASEIVVKFRERFPGEPTLIKANGRINLIGEHTDYNNGFVLPGAVDKHIFFAMRPNGGRTTNFYAADIDESFSFSLDDFGPGKTLWANYLMGIFQQMQKDGHELGGIDCVFGGTLPIGSGMSSSAAMECGMGFGLKTLFDLPYERMELALLGQRSSHQFVGVPCGIMDQFTSMMGKKDHLVLLDCRSLEYEYYPADLPGYELVLLNSKVSHDLADGAYAKRVAQCKEGVEILRKHYPEVESLRDVQPAMLKRHQAEFDPVVYKRCKYVVEEGVRVKQVCELLEKNDAAAIGHLLFQTHQGLSKDYEVSCEEIDWLVDFATGHPAAIGARVMGGGFGGCTINLVRAEEVETFTAAALEAYHANFNVQGEAYVVGLDDGTEALSL